jgi:hypothetical protein
MGILFRVLLAAVGAIAAFVIASQFRPRAYLELDRPEERRVPNVSFRS